MTRPGRPAATRPPAIRPATIRPATIRDVARAAGLSIATVSRALNRPELLNEDTRRIVNEAVARLDYRPSVAAKRLRGNRTDLILVVVPSLSPFFLDIFAGVEAAAERAGFSVLVGHTDRNSARERLFVDQVGASRADGIILVTSVDLPTLTGMGWLPPTVVALDVDGGGGLPMVRVDHVAGAEDATNILLNLGHTRVAHILGPERSGMTRHRLEGYQRALAAHGLNVNPDYCVRGDFTVESGVAAINALLALPSPPTAVFAANDQMAIGAIRGLRRRGLQVPRDMSIFGFDDERIAALCDPPLSTVRIPTFEIGRTAMEQMLRLLEGAGMEHDLVLPTELVIRDTAAPAPDRA